jgi:membrane protease YdiL (CAAX protease family)
MNASSNDSSIVLAVPVPSGEHPLAPPDEERVALVQPTRPAPGFLGSLGWLFVLFLVVQLVPWFIAGAFAAVLRLELIEVAFPAVFGGQVLGTALAVLLFRLRLGKRWMAELGLNRLPLLSTLLAILCVPGLQVLAGGIIFLCRFLLGSQDVVGQAIRQTAPDQPWWLLLLALAVGPALNEELWFRGFLGRGLVGRYGPMIGILVTSVLFGVFHLNLVQGLYAVMLGLALHLIYRATRSLWVPILVHFVFNSVGVSLAYLSAGSEPAELDSTAKVVVVLIWVGALSVLAAAGWGLYRLRSRVAEAEPAR